MVVTIVDRVDKGYPQGTQRGRKNRQLESEKTYSESRLGDRSQAQYPLMAAKGALTDLGLFRLGCVKPRDECSPPGAKDTRQTDAFSSITRYCYQAYDIIKQRTRTLRPKQSTCAQSNVARVEISHKGSG